MSRSENTDLSTNSPVPSKPSTPRPRDHPVAAPPRTSSALPIDDPGPIISNLKFPVKDSYGGSAHGFLHMPPTSAKVSPVHSRTAAILLSGAGGGVTGPSGMYLSLATKLPSLPQLPIKVLRLDYRYAARTGPCVEDAKAAMTYLGEHFAVDRFVLVGWSFGGAPVFTLAGRDERVVGAATVASQTADALKGAREAGRRNVPVMLLHGTGDQTLSDRCSRHLHEAWYEGYKGPGEGEEKTKLILFDGDDHSLSRNVEKAEQFVANFVIECAGGEVEDGKEVVQSEVMGDSEERKDAMKKGGDLRGNESLE